MMKQAVAKRHMFVAGTVAVIAFTLMLITRGDYDPNAFWSSYHVGTWGCSLLILIVSMLWLLASAAHAFSDFFDAKRSIQPGALGLSLLLITVVTVLAISIALPKTPRTAPDRLPKEPELREKKLSQERNFRFVTVMLILLIGGTVASVPVRRFMST